MTNPKKIICAVVVNDLGDILPYTCQATMDACEEWLQENMPGAWPTMKRLGARVVQAELVILDRHVVSKEEPPKL